MLVPAPGHPAAPAALRPRPGPHRHHRPQAGRSALQAALQQKDILLREVPPVKNNLQVISSLLSLQEGAVDDPRLGTLFQVSQERLHAMALVHDLLQQTEDVARINLGQYAARLIEEVARTYAVDPARLTLETASRTSGSAWTPPLPAASCCTSC